MLLPPLTVDTTRTPMFSPLRVHDLFSLWQGSLCLPRPAPGFTNEIRFVNGELKINWMINCEILFLSRESYRCHGFR